MFCSRALKAIFAAAGSPLTGSVVGGGGGGGRERIDLSSKMCVLLDHSRSCDPQREKERDRDRDKERDRERTMYTRTRAYPDL